MMALIFIVIEKCVLCAILNKLNNDLSVLDVLFIYLFGN